MEDQTPNITPTQNTTTQAITTPHTPALPPLQTEKRTALLGLGGVLVFFSLSWFTWPSQAPEVQVSTPTRLQESPLFATPASSQSTEEIVLQLTSKPPGAYVVGFASGVPIQAEPTPSTLQVPKGANIELTFIAPGFKPELKVLTADKEQEVSVTLIDQKKSTGRFNGFR
jgi:hypothetical protein